MAPGTTGSSSEIALRFRDNRTLAKKKKIAIARQPFTRGARHATSNTPNIASPRGHVSWRPSRLVPFILLCHFALHNVAFTPSHRPQLCSEAISRHPLISDFGGGSACELRVSCLDEGTHRQTGQRADTAERTAQDGQDRGESASASNGTTCSASALAARSRLSLTGWRCCNIASTRTPRFWLRCL